METLISLLNSTNWKRVAILYDTDNVFYRNTKSLLINELRTNTNVKVEFLSAISFNFFPLDGIMQARTPIVFVLAPLELTQRIICLARNRSMIFPNFQWVLMDNRFKELTKQVNFIHRNLKYSCSKKDIYDALEKSFLMISNFEVSNDTLLVSNITFSQYREKYNEMTRKYNSLEKPARNSTYSYWGGLYYDAVWAWALVLDNLTESEGGFNSYSSHGNSKYSAEVLVDQFYQLSFQGASGQINFDRETGFSQKEVHLYQISNSQEKLLLLSDTMADIIIIISYPTLLRIKLLE